MIEQYGSLDSLYVSIDRVDIPLFFNSLDVFAESIISFVELVIVIRINASYLLNAPAGTPKIKKTLWAFIRSFTVYIIFISALNLLFLGDTNRMIAEVRFYF